MVCCIYTFQNFKYKMTEQQTKSALIRLRDVIFNILRAAENKISPEKSQEIAKKVFKELESMDSFDVYFWPVLHVDDDDSAEKLRGDLIEMLITISLEEKVTIDYDLADYIVDELLW